MKSKVILIVHRQGVTHSSIGILKYVLLDPKSSRYSGRTLVTILKALHGNEILLGMISERECSACLLEHGFLNK